MKKIFKDTGRAVSAYVGRCRKAAFYNNGRLWEARWLDGYNSVRIDSKTKMRTETPKGSVWKISGWIFSVRVEL